MSNQFEQIKRDIMSAMRSNKPRTSAYDTTAEVLYVEGETAWVRIPGGAPETPVDLSVAAKQGDIVQVRVANGRAWINGNNTAPPTDDTVAVAAHTVATETKEQVDELEEHFWYDGSGAHVEGESYRNDMKSDGLHIVEKNTGETVAKFGAGGSQIGKDGEAHTTFDFRSQQMVDMNGTVFYDVRDLRDADGVVEYTQIFFGDGSTTGFNASYPVVSLTTITTDVVVKVAGTTKTYQTDYTLGYTQGNMFIVIMTDAPASGEKVEITYPTVSAMQVFTFGSRSDASAGAQSAAFGAINEASGQYSFAQGRSAKAQGYTSFASGQNTQAAGSTSFAEGNSTKAMGNFSHAEGNGSRANGNNSHAQNNSTVTGSNDQTAIGKYNVEDSNNVYGLIMGNGTLQNRSNAFGVTWDGDYEFQADGDLLTALTAKGWNVAGTGGLVSLKKILANIINAL